MDIFGSPICWPVAVGSMGMVGVIAYLFIVGNLERMTLDTAQAAPAGNPALHKS